jgi:hypothetical protein
MPVINPQTGAELLQFQASIVPSNLDNARANLEDFVYNGLAGRYGSLWTNSNSGAGSSVSINTASTADHPGILEIRAGTPNAGASLVIGATNAIILPTGAWEYRTMLMLQAISDAVNRYTARAGLGDQSVLTDATDGVYFEYTGINAGNWLCCTASNGGRTKTLSGVVPQALTWTELRIVGNGTSSIDFYIDGVLVATNTLNIPVGAARATNIVPGQMVKSLGAVTRSMFVDYVYYGYSYRNAR